MLFFILLLFKSIDYYFTIVLYVTKHMKKKKIIKRIIMAEKIKLLIYSNVVTSAVVYTVIDLSPSDTRNPNVSHKINILLISKIIIM